MHTAKPNTSSGQQATDGDHQGENSKNPIPMSVIDYVAMTESERSKKMTKSEKEKAEKYERRELNMQKTLWKEAKRQRKLEKERDCKLTTSNTHP